MVRAFAISLLAAATLTACATERDIGGNYDESDYQIEQDEFQNDRWNEGSDYGNLEVGQGRTFGTMGPVSDISGIATASGYQDQDHSSVELVTTNGNGSAMHIISFTGDLSQLEPGQKYTFNSDNYETAYDMESGATSGIFATSLNCSGTGAPGAWDYDAQADEVSLTVTETGNEGELKVDYETISSDSLFGNDVSGGEFTIQQ